MGTKTAENGWKKECSADSLWNFATVQSLFTVSVHPPTSTAETSLLAVQLLCQASIESTFPHKPAERHYNQFQSLHCKSCHCFIYPCETKQKEVPTAQPSKHISHCSDVVSLHDGTPPPHKNVCWQKAQQNKHQEQHSNNDENPKYSWLNIQYFLLNLWADCCSLT